MIFSKVEIRYRVNGNQLETVCIAQDKASGHWQMLAPQSGYPMELEQLEKWCNLATGPDLALEKSIIACQVEIQTTQGRIDQYQRMLEEVSSEPDKL